MERIEVEIVAVSDAQVTVSIQYGRAGTAVIRRWHADRAVLDAVCGDLAELLVDSRREPLTDEEKLRHQHEVESRMKSLGLALFQEILKDEGDRIRSMASRSEMACCLIFKIDKTLAYLPLELMYDGEDFVFQQLPMGRMIYAEEVREVPPPNQDEPHLALIIGDPSDDPAIRADVESEIDALKRVFADLSDFALKIAVGAQADQRFMLRELPGATVFHLSGHGEVSGEEDLTGIRLAGGKVLTGKALSGLQNPPALAFLNICTAAPRSAWRGTLGLVETLLRRGTRACLASLWDLGSKAAAVMATRFYAHLLHGETFGLALARARRDTAGVTGLHDPTWAAYALYGDPAATLLGREPAQSWRMRALRRFALIAGALFVLALILFPASIHKETLGTRPILPVGYLMVESTPSDATIIVDGEAKGLTPSSLEIATGSHHVVLEKQGYRRWEAWVTVRKTPPVAVKATLVKLE